MSKSLVGRCGGKRVILWGRVCAWGLDAAIVALVLFLIVTCVVGASSEAPFFETWWGHHVFVLLLGSLALAALIGAALPLRRWVRVPLEQLPDLDVALDDAGSEEHSARRIRWRGAAALVAVVAAPLLVVLFYLEENARGEHAWNRYKQQQEARGERLDPAAVAPPAVPDDQNFAATPFLAPLFDFLPGTQQARDPSAAGRTKSLSPRYEAASSHLKPSKLARSNSWVIAELDLPAWQAAFLQGTNSAPLEKEALRAFRLRYGFLTVQTNATSDQPSATNPQLSTNSPTRPEAARVVLAALAEAEPVLEELRAASRRLYSRFNLRYETDNPATILLPHYAVLKRAVQVLQLRASAELALGDTDLAAEDIQFMFRLADAIRNEPILIGQLVRLGEFNIALQPLAEGLARHQWSESQLRAFQEQLRQFDFLADGRRALQGERDFFGVGVIEWLRRSPNRYRALQSVGFESGSSQESELSWQSAVLAAVPTGWLYLEKLNYSRTFEEYLMPCLDVPGGRVNPDACRRAAAYFEAPSNTSWLARVLRHQFFSGLLLPAMSGAAQKTALTQTGADCAALACALERFRLAHGQFPESLDALMPEFSSQQPHDVINGQPLKYHRTADGQYLLYSVGWNQTDDGGVLGRVPGGQGTDQKAGDWVWRLPAGS